MKHCPKGTKIQTIMFDVARWTPAKAKKWLADHGFAAPPYKVHTTYQRLRYRQAPPAHFKKGSFRTIDLDAAAGIQAVIGCPLSKSNPKRAKVKTPRPVSIHKRRACNAAPKQKAVFGRFTAVLVHLGRAVKLHNEDWGFRWSRPDNMQLYTNVKGDQLFILKVGEPVEIQSRVQAALDKYAPQVKAAAALYRRWHDFESAGGSIIAKPKGEFRPIGRVHNIVYVSDKWTGKEVEYIHEFKTPPLASANGKDKPTAVIVRGGKLKVTARGITG